MSEEMIPWSKAYDANRITLMDALPLSLPLCICIEPTNVCNFKCYFETTSDRKLR